MQNQGYYGQQPYYAGQGNMSPGLNDPFVNNQGYGQQQQYDVQDPNDYSDRFGCLACCICCDCCVCCCEILLCCCIADSM